jgi:hypothetical protein
MFFSLMSIVLRAVKTSGDLLEILLIACLEVIESARMRHSWVECAGIFTAAFIDDWSLRKMVIMLGQRKGRMML